MLAIVVTYGVSSLIDWTWFIPGVTVPALVLRATREILPGFRFILPAAEAERFVAAVPSAVLAEVEANHYTITTHDDSIASIVRSCARGDSGAAPPWPHPVHR